MCETLNCILNKLYIYILGVPKVGLQITLRQYGGSKVGLQLLHYLFHHSNHVLDINYIK